MGSLGTYGTGRKRAASQRRAFLLVFGRDRELGARDDQDFILPYLDPIDRIERRSMGLSGQSLCLWIGMPWGATEI